MILPKNLKSYVMEVSQKFDENGLTVQESLSDMIFGRYKPILSCNFSLVIYSIFKSLKKSLQHPRLSGIAQQNESAENNSSLPFYL